MTQTAERLARYEDLLALPEHLVGEILNGVLYAQPRPAARHALAQSALGFLIGGPFHGGIGGPGGWWILDEPELHLGPDVLVPDLAGWRRSRLPVIPDVPWFDLAPDWVCEILSPATAAKDRALKRPIYARARVEHLWLIDPETRTLEVYRLNPEGQWVLLDTLEGDSQVQQPPFEAASFPLSALWTD